ncbi:MAG: hypothetical protein ACMUIG_07325 [Thermoplasmatota archaeon]
MNVEWLFWVYLAIGLGSLLLLIVMLVIGGLDVLGFDFDVGDVDVDGIDIDVDSGGPGMGPLSIPIILSFLSGFGGIGALLTLFDVDYRLTPFFAAGGAFLMAGILFGIMQLFLRQFTSDSTVQINRLKGRRGKVTVPIKPGVEGQIAIFTQQRGRTLVPAVADTKIPENTDVVVIAATGDVVKVKKITKTGKSVKEADKKR